VEAIIGDKSKDKGTFGLETHQIRIWSKESK